MRKLTPEEQQVMGQVQEFLKRLNTQFEGERVCVMCGQQIDAIKQVRGSVYARGVSRDDCTDGEKEWRHKLGRGNLWCRQYRGVVPEDLKDIQVKGDE